MVTLSSSDVTTVAPQRTTNGPKDGATSKRSDSMSNLVEVGGLRDHQPGPNSGPQSGPNGRLSVKLNSDPKMLNGKELDLNSLPSDGIERIGDIVDALERLRVLEPSRDICYSVSQIVRHKMTDNKSQVEISLVVNTYSTKDLLASTGSSSGSGVLAGATHDAKSSDRSIDKSNTNHQVSPEHVQISRCLRNKPAIMLLDNSTVSENDTSSVTYDMSSDTGNASMVDFGGRSPPSGNGGHQVVADHPKGQCP